jgi:hypothetical protein
MRVLPRTVSGEALEQIGEQNLWREFGSKAGKPIGTLPFASLTANSYHHERVLAEGVPHEQG